MTRARLLVLCAVAFLGWGTASASAASWSLVPVGAPDGTPGSFSLGAVGDLKFWAPNRGLVTVEGTGVMPRGIYRYDGVSWRPLATVCGGQAANARIAWAGPQEFWVVADTNPLQFAPRVGFSLCRFKDGGVTSFAVPDSAPDNWHTLRSATCVAENDCWFAGDSADSNDGVRSGVFHVRALNGQTSTFYDRIGGTDLRGALDVEGHRGQLVEAVRNPADKQKPVARLAGPAFVRDPLTILPPASETPQALALDSDGTRLWVGGGGSVDVGDRTGMPFLAVATSGAFTEIPLSHPALRSGDRVVDIAAAPGTGRAWVAIAGALEEGQKDVYGRVALVDEAAGVLQVDELPGPGIAPRGSVSRIDCTAIDDCWAATAGGWLFHLSDGRSPGQDGSFSFGSTITNRPRDGRSTQVRPDTPPVDDSLLFAAAPGTDDDQTTTQEAAAPKRVSALIAKVRAKLRGRKRMVITFTLRRRASVRIVGTRRGKTVARSARKTFSKGRRSLTLRLNPRRYPTKISFQTKDLELPETTAPASDDGVVTTRVSRLPHVEGWR